MEMSTASMKTMKERKMPGTEKEPLPCMLQVPGSIVACFALQIISLYGWTVRRTAEPVGRETETDYNNAEVTQLTFRTGPAASQVSWSKVNHSCAKMKNPTRERPAFAFHPRRTFCSSLFLPGPNASRINFSWKTLTFCERFPSPANVNDQSTFRPGRFVSDS